MGDPSNRNQSHLVKGGRSTSRVLAPPGGRSSLSLGGYGGPADFPRSTYGNAPAPHYKAPVSYAGDRDREREREREREPREVPGLENHYVRRAGGMTSGVPDGVDVSGGGGSSVGFYESGVGARRGPLAGDDYAAQLRAQIAMKKQIDADANDHFDRRVSLRRSATDDTDYGSAMAISADRQAVLRRAADTRHDEAMQAYRGRQESSRERDYRRMQNNEEDDDDRRHYRLTTKNVRDVAADREQENRRFNSVNSNTSARRDSFGGGGGVSSSGSGSGSGGGGGGGGGGMAATLRGDASNAFHASTTTKRRVGGNNDGRKRDSFSIGWE